jgi:hypothetical protein
VRAIKMRLDKSVKRKAVKYAVYIAAIVVFVIYLSNANRIVLSIMDGKHVLYKSDMRFSELRQAAGDTEVISPRRRYYASGGQKKQIAVYGFAYIEADPSDFQRQVKVIVVDENDTAYFSDATLGHGANYYFRALNEGMRVPCTDIAYSARFSTLALKDGTYRMFLYVRETPYVFGIRSISASFVIDGNELSRSVALSSGIELPVDIRHKAVFHVTALMVRMEVSRSLLGFQPRPSSM